MGAEHRPQDGGSQGFRFALAGLLPPEPPLLQRETLHVAVPCD